MAGSPALSDMRFRNDTEQPVHALPISQMTDGAAGLASASRSSPSLLLHKPSAVADRVQ